MLLIDRLLEQPATLDVTSRYSIMNAFIYLALGVLLIVWPAAVQTLFRDRAFVGDEGGLFRALGLTVVVIGWLYLFGGRSGSAQLGPASVIDRLIFVPMVLLPLVFVGVFPHIFAAFTLLDMSLAVGAWVLFNRSK